MKNMKICSIAILLVLLVGCALLFLSCDNQTVTDPCANGHTEVVDAAVPATCTSKGLSEGKHCSVCNKVLTAQEPTDKLAHTEGEWVVTLEPSCTTKGSQYRKCTVCKDIVESQTVDALAHQYGEPNVTKKATCTQDGSQTLSCARCNDVKTEKIAALSHDADEWKTDTDRPATCSQAGVETRSCKRCSATVAIRSTGTLAHDLKEETKVATVCGTAGTLTRTCQREGCYYKEVEPLETVACTLGEPEVIVPATCGKDGLQHTACTVCGKITPAIIPALTHSFGEAVTVNATCKAEGSVTRACLNAGCTEKQVTILPLRDHTPGTPEIVVAAKCEQVGVQHTACTVCGEITISEIPAPGHSFTEWDIQAQPSCTTTGLQTRACTNTSCNKVERELLPTASHDYIDWVIDLEADCATAGLKHRNCRVCTAVQVVTIEKPRHDYPATYTTTANPTCATMGQKERTCPNCNYTEKVSIPTIAHTPGTWTTILEASANADGSKKQECTVCHNIIALEIIPATSGPVQLTYTVSGGKATVTGYTALAGETLVIPETLGGYPVVKISAYAFQNATRFTSITLPASLTTIEKGAFEGCSLLKSENGLTTLGTCLIAVDKGLAEITIPATVNKIAEGAFDECYRLVHITNLSGVATLTGLPTNADREIRTSTSTAFQNTFATSNGITTFKVGSVTYLFDCTLTSLSLPNSAFTKVYPYALQNNTTLKTLTIAPNYDLSNVGTYAFGGCQIETLSCTIDAVCRIDSYTLTTSGVVPTAHLKSLTITGTPNEIPSNFLSGCSTLETLVIPNTVGTTRKMAFVGCTGIKNLTGPAEMMTQEAAANCVNLETLKINGGTVIASKVFSSNKNLKTVTIAASVTHIKGQAFHTCSALETVTFESGSQLQNLAANVFSSTKLKSINLPTGLLEIGSQCFMSCSNLAAIKLPSTVTKMDEEVFNGCTSLEEIVIPASVESIGNRTANNVVRGVFNGCTSLKKVTFASGSKLKMIPTYAFYGCTSLTSITIPASVTSIGFSAFEKSGVTSITFENTSGWKVYKLTDFSKQVKQHEFKNLGTGTEVTVTNAATNATSFKSTYIKYFWVRG